MDTGDAEGAMRLVFRTPELLGTPYAWEIRYDWDDFRAPGALVVARVVHAVPAVAWVPVESISSS